MNISSALATACCILLLAIIMIAGCTGTSGNTVIASYTNVSPGATSLPGTTPVTPAATSSPAAAAGTNEGTAMTANTLYVNSTSNGGIVSIPIGNRVLVRLNENPTTGYRWNATVPNGISVISDTFVPPNSALIGAGGYHEWLLEPQAVDTYTFRAVYFRPWETPRADDTSYQLVILVTKE